MESMETVRKPVFNTIEKHNGRWHVGIVKHRGGIVGHGVLIDGNPRLGVACDVDGVYVECFCIGHSSDGLGFLETKAGTIDQLTD